MLIEIDKNRFVNPALVFGIELLRVSTGDKTKYYWRFYPSDGNGEWTFLSKTFDSEEEAKKWLLSVLPFFRP